jgi:NADPH2:quinone reductase
MKIVEARTLESIADYAMREVPMPVPEANQVLIGVHACGVGYVDALVSLGRYQVKPSLPHTPGQEVSGHIAALGSAVTGLAVGDRVMARVTGGFAQFVNVAAGDVLRIPDRMSTAQAAAFRVNYLTALHGLRDRGALAQGETLLVLGAAGGVGAAAVQIGRLMGARVIATGSTPAKRDFAQAVGAHEVLDTLAQGWRDRLKALCGGRGPDVVFDPVCGPLFELAFRSLNWGGRHLVVGFVGGPIPSLPANLSLLKGSALVGVDVRQFLLFEADKARAEIDELLGWVGDGQLVPPAGREFAFEDYRQALEYALSGQGLGKTLLRISAPAH